MNVWFILEFVRNSVAAATVSLTPYIPLIVLIALVAVATVYLRNYVQSVRVVLLRVRGVFIGGKPDIELGAANADSLSLLWLSKDILENTAKALGRMFTMADVNSVSQRREPFAQAVTRSASLEFAKYTKTIKEYEQALQAKTLEYEQIVSEKNRIETAYNELVASITTNEEELERRLTTINELDTRVRRLDKELHAEQIQRKRLQREVEGVTNKTHRENAQIDSNQRKIAEALALMSPVVDKLAAQAVGLEAEDDEDADSPAVGFSGARRIPTAIRKRRFSSPSFSDASADPLASARRILEMNRMKVIRGAGAGAKPSDSETDNETDSDKPVQPPAPKRETIVIEDGAIDTEADAFRKALRQNELIREDIVLSARTLLEHVNSLESENREHRQMIDRLRGDIREREQRIESFAAEEDGLRRSLAEFEAFETSHKKQEEQSASYIEALNAQIVEHSETVAALTEDMAEKQKQMETLRSLIENEALEAERYRQDYLKAANDLNEQQLRLKSETMAREALTEKNAELESRLNALETTTQTSKERQNEIDDLTARIAELQRERLAHHASKTDTEAQYEKAKTRLDEALTKLKSREQEVASLKAQLEQYKYIKKQAEMQSVKIENMTTIERQLEASRSENAALSGKIAELEETLKQRAVESNDQAARLDELRQENARQTDALDAARADVASLDAALAKARSEIETLKAESMARASDAEAMLHRQIDQLEADRNRLASVNDELNLKIENFEFRIADLDMQLSKHRDIKTETEKQLADLRQSLANAESTIARQDALSRETKSKLALTERELSNYRDLCETHRKTIDDLKVAHEQSRVEISERLARYKDERFNDKDAIQQMKRELTSREKTIAGLTGTLDKAKRDIDDLKATLQKAEAGVEETKRLEKELEQMRFELSATQDANDKLQAQILTADATGSAELDKLRREKSGLTEELSETRAQMEAFRKLLPESPAARARTVLPALTSGYDGLRPSDLLRAPAEALESAALPDHSEFIHSLGASTVSQLAHHWLIKRATLLTLLAEVADTQMTLTDFGELVSLVSPEAAVSSLGNLFSMSVMNMADIGEIVTDMTTPARAGIRTIGDLVTWRAWREARALALLA